MWWNFRRLNTETIIEKENATENSIDNRFFNSNDENQKNVYSSQF